MTVDDWERRKNDRLRDRIAVQLELGTHCCELCWGSAQKVAQRVIDDLQLVYIETGSSVVGKWGPND